MTCVRCNRHQHHEAHARGVCDYLPPGRSSAERQRERIAARRELAEAGRVAMARDKGCVLRAPELGLPDCDTTFGLQRHHRLTRGRSGGHEPENIAILCSGHHDWLHHTGEGQRLGREIGLLLHAGTVPA